MDTKLLINLCSIVVCLFVFGTNGTQLSKSDDNQGNTVANILQDMQMAAGEHYHDEGGHEDHGFFNKAVKGGYEKGSKKYGMDEFNKKGNDHGKSGLKKYDAKDKWGQNKWDKKKLDSFGDKYASKKAKEDKAKFEEWADQKKWKTDKGKGYEKAYEYDKSEGKKEAYGKKGKNDMSKFAENKGEKHGLNKKEAMGKDHYGKKANNGKMKWQDYGKMYKMGGKNNKGMNYHEKKKPSMHKSAKWEKKEKKQKKPKMEPKKKQEDEAEEHDEEAYDEGAMGEEDTVHDGQGYGMEGQDMEGHEMASEYDTNGALAYDDVGLAGVAAHEIMPQEEAYAALAKAGYVIDETGAAVPMSGHETEFY